MPEMPSDWPSRRFTTYAAVIILAISIIAAGAVVYRRQAAISLSPEVELAIDYDEVLRSAHTLNYDPEALLLQLRQAGLTTLVVRERTLEEIKDFGEAGVLDGSDLAALAMAGRDGGVYQALQAAGRYQPWYTYILTPDPGLATRLHEAVARRLGAQRTDWMQVGETQVVTVQGVTRQEGPADPVTGKPPLELVTLAGYMPGDLAAAGRLGLRVAPVVSNQGYPGPVGIEAILAGFQKDATEAQTTVSAVLFDEDQVLGYPKATAAVGERLKRLGCPVGIVSGGRPAGLEDVVRSAGFRAIKVAPVTPDARLEDNLLKAKDRGYRLLVAGPFMYPSADAATTIGIARDFVASIRDGLSRAGFEVGPARPIGPLAVPWGLTFLVGWGVLVALGMVVEELVPGAGRWRLAWLLVAGGLSGIAAHLPAPAIWSDALALIAAAVYSSWGVLSVLRLIFERRRGFGLAGSIGLAVTMTALSVAGGTVITALLASPPYFLELSLFRGVKVAFVLPLLIVAAALLVRTAGPGRVLAGAVTAAEHELTFGDGVWLAFAGLLGLVYLGRSGNAPSLPVSGVETRLRALLDRFLAARPRTKEFLIGQPAAVLLGRRPWTSRGAILGLALLATVGQVSVVNSFAHLHTPYPTSLVRSLNGLVLGLLVGAILSWIAGRLWPDRTAGSAEGSEPE